MIGYYKSNKIFFKIVSIVIIALFLSNEVSYAIGPSAPKATYKNLSPINRNNPMGFIQSNDGILEVVDDPSAAKLQTEEIREQAGLIYINKLMNSIFERVKRSLITEELIRDLICEDLSKTGLTLNRFNWEEVQETLKGAVQYPHPKIQSPMHACLAIAAAKRGDQDRAKEHLASAEKLIGELTIWADKRPEEWIYELIAEILLEEARELVTP